MTTEEAPPPPSEPMEQTAAEDTGEPGVEAQEQEAPASEPIGEVVEAAVEPTPEVPGPSNAASSEPAESTAESSSESPFVPPAKWTEIRKTPPTGEGARPKKVTLSEVKKRRSQENKNKSKPTAFEALMQQPAPRIAIPLGFVNTTDCLIGNENLVDLTDAQGFVHQQKRAFMDKPEQLHPSTMLVNELKSVISDRTASVTFGATMANHLVAFLKTVECLHEHQTSLFAIPHLVALFPPLDDYRRNPPCLREPTTNYEAVRNEVIVIGRMLQDCGAKTYPDSPPREIHDVCYAYMCRMKAYYPEISMKDIHEDADEPQLDEYSEVKARAERRAEQALRQPPKPVPPPEVPIQEPKGFGRRPWDRTPKEADDVPPPPPPPPPATASASVTASASRPTSTTTSEPDIQVLLEVPTLGYR